jgi:hypothetical protein
MVQEPGGETVLTGPVIDQAALHGIPNRIRDLGLPLLSVRRLAQDGAEVEGDGANGAWPESRRRGDCTTVHHPKVQ